MNISFQLGVLESYVLYFFILFGSCLTAFLSQLSLKQSKGKHVYLSQVFWFLTFLILTIPLMFRGSGVDNDSYLRIFNEISTWSSPLNYSGFPEPLFTLINVVSDKVFHSFQMTYVMSGGISIWFILKTLKQKQDHINVVFVLFVFGFTQYFYFYGLVRMMLAVSILSYGVTFLERQRPVSFVKYALIAGLFHYSALIILPIYIMVYFISRYQTKVSILKTAVLMLVIIPFTFIIATQLFRLMFNQMSWFARYNQYFNIRFIPGAFNTILWALPILLILLLFGPRIQQKMKHYALHVNIYFVMLSFAILGVLFGVQRFTYFMFISGYYLYDSFFKLRFSWVTHRSNVYVYSLLMFVFGCLWLLIVVLGGEHWFRFMIPYQFLL